MIASSPSIYGPKRMPARYVRTRCARAVVLHPHQAISLALQSHLAISLALQSDLAAAQAPALAAAVAMSGVAPIGVPIHHRTSTIPPDFYLGPSLVCRQAVLQRLLSTRYSVLAMLMNEFLDAERFLMHGDRVVPERKLLKAREDIARERELIVATMQELFKMGVEPFTPRVALNMDVARVLKVPCLVESAARLLGSAAMVEISAADTLTENAMNATLILLENGIVLGCSYVL